MDPMGRNFARSCRSCRTLQRPPLRCSRAAGNSVADIPERLSRLTATGKSAMSDGKAEADMSSSMRAQAIVDRTLCLNNEAGGDKNFFKVLHHYRV